MVLQANIDRTPELSEADMVVFLGDLNYRLQGITYEEARYLISQTRLELLTEKDQLRAEMKAGRVFQGFREGVIKFPPTYKFEKHLTGLSGMTAKLSCGKILGPIYRQLQLMQEENSNQKFNEFTGKLLRDLFVPHIALMLKLKLVNLL